MFGLSKSVVLSVLWSMVCPRLLGLNVFLATDSNYVVQTAVSMHSFLRTQVNEPDIFFVIFCDKTGNSWTTRHEHILKKFEQPGQIGVCLVDMANIKEDLFVAAQRKFEHSKAMALKVVLPDLWVSKGLPEFREGAYRERLRGIRHFVWLGSDVLVMKHLRPLLDEVGYGTDAWIHQPVTSANLDFIYSKGDTASRYHDYGIRSHAGWIPFDKIGALDEKGSARVSGGILVYKLDCIPRKLKCFPPNQRRHSRPTTKSILTQCFDVSSGKTEEGVFDVLLQRSQDQVYFFSTLYNCRPGYVPVAQNFLRNFPNLSAAQSSAELSYIGSKDVQKETFNTLLSIANSNVAIWHWDYSASGTSRKDDGWPPRLGVVPELKPWCAGSVMFGSPEALWREEYEAVKQMFEEDAEVVQLFTAWEAQNFKG